MAAEYGCVPDLEGSNEIRVPAVVAVSIFLNEL